MRSWQALAMVAMVAGCASEQGIYGGVDPDGAGTELGGPDDGRPGDDDDDWNASTDPIVEAGAVEGRVCAPDGETYLSLATVTVLTDYGNVTGLTDGEGYFLIDAVPVGTWPIIVEKGSFSVSHEVTIEAGQRTSLATEVCVPLDPSTVDIAVVTGSYDSIEDVLDVLAIDYTLVNGRSGTQHVGLLRDPAALAQYDILFLNCGMGEQWRDHQAEVAANLKEFVQNGGSIYASDWAYYLVEATWPARNDFHGDDGVFGDAAVGDMGKVDATLLDAAMIELMGQGTARLNFDLGMWVAMSDVGADAEVLLEGTYQWSNFYGGGGGQAHGPLATRLHDGLGTAVFTSFHNERQATDDMAKLLQEIILSL